MNFGADAKKSVCGWNLWKNDRKINLFCQLNFVITLGEEKKTFLYFYIFKYFDLKYKNSVILG